MTETDTSSDSDISVAIDEVQEHAQIIEQHDAILVLAHRDNRLIETVDLERFESEPRRQRGTVKALSAAGFVDAFKHRTHEPEGPSAAVIYANPDSCALVAVLNDDVIATPGWRDHRIELALQATPEWLHWTNNAGLRSQAAFAQVIEDGETDIVGSPSATTMLEIAESFHASVGAKFKQVSRLKSGLSQLAYEEDIDAKGKTSEGLVPIPDSFTVSVRPFYGAEARELPCRIRFRIAGGELTIGYTLNRPDEVKREAFATDVLGEVREQLAGFTVVEGVPAQARS